MGIREDHERAEAAIAQHLRDQEGVVSRRQVVAAGAGDALVERRLRRREWARLHEGVYVNHTGTPTWDQRAWAGVLLHPVAALDGASALRVAGVRTTGPPTDPVELVVPGSRRVQDPTGVSSRRLVAFEASCLLHLSPPRLRLEPAALRVASRARTEDETVAVLGDVVQTHFTTAERLRESLDTLQRVPRRVLMAEVLADVGVGALSALERRYLRDVERPHGLPRARRQVRNFAGSAAVYRDAAYDDHRVVVELDGTLGHTTAADRWADLGRDLEASVAGLVTLRAGWQQVLDPCRLARTVGAVLGSRGWTGAPQPCRRCGPTPVEILAEVRRQPAPENLRQEPPARHERAVETSTSAPAVRIDVAVLQTRGRTGEPRPLHTVPPDPDRDPGGSSSAAGAEEPPPGTAAAGGPRRRALEAVGGGADRAQDARGDGRD